MAKITSQINFNPFNNNINNNNNNTINENSRSDESIVNIPNDEAYSVCQRCKQKESVFSCIICESFKFLCTKCDNYIHSLPSKQAHQRIAILSNRNNENLKKEESKILKFDEINQNNNNNNHNNLNPNTSIDLNYKFNLSPINRLNNINKDKDLSGVDYNAFVNQNKNQGSNPQNNSSVMMSNNNYYNNNNNTMNNVSMNLNSYNRNNYGNIDESNGIFK